MKSVKILSIVAIQVAMFAATAAAQTSQPAQASGKRADKMIERMEQRLAALNLTADQKQKIQTILQNGKQQMQAWAQAHQADLQALKTMPADQRRAAMQKLMADRQAAMKNIRQQIKAVLTPDQLQQLKASRHAGATSRPAGAASRPAGGGERTQQAFAQLNLTADQKAKIQTILQAAHQQAQSATTPQDKRAARQQAMQKILNTVLTPDQKAQFLKAHPRLGGAGGSSAS